MLSPNSAQDLVRPIRELYAEAEAIILQKVARNLARGIDDDSWAFRKRDDLRRLNAELDQVLADLEAGLPGAVDRAMNLAYERGASAAAGELAAGRFVAPVVKPSLVAFTEATVESLASSPFRVRRWTDDVYSRVARETSAQILTGTLTRREASSQALKRYAVNGVTGFVDKAGKRWDMASYAEMSARTTAAQSSLQGHTDKIQSLGLDLVLVSDAPEECAICRPWEGKVLSISGSSRGRAEDGVTIAGSVSEATSAGLYHPNCRHSQSVYLPGITKRYGRTADPVGDANRQKQRAGERRVREWKRRSIIDDELLGKDSEGARRTRRYLNTARADLRKHIEDNDLKTLAYRTSLTSR